MAGVTAAVIGGAAAVGSTAMSSRSARDAARTQARSADAASAENARQFDVAQEHQRPFREFGESFLDDLNQVLTGEYNPLNDPALAFQLDDATRTLDNRAAHAGKFFQPRTVEALMGTRDAIIANHRADRINELFGAVQLGQNTAVNQATQAINHGQSQADLLLQRGNAIAAGTVGSANAVNAGIAGVTDALTTYAGTRQQNNYNPAPVAMSDPNANTRVINEALIGGGGG